MMTADRQGLAFTTRGHRRKPDCGLYYRSRCGRYALYLSDQLYGIAIDPVRWLAIYVGEDGVERVIGKHRRRGRAEQTCKRHAAKVARAERQPKRRRRSQ